MALQIEGARRVGIWSKTRFHLREDDGLIGIHFEHWWIGKRPRPRHWTGIWPCQGNGSSDPSMLKWRKPWFLGFLGGQFSRFHQMTDGMSWMSILDFNEFSWILTLFPEKRRCETMAFCWEKVSLGNAYGDLGNVYHQKELLEKALNIQDHGRSSPWCWWDISV